MESRITVTNDHDRYIYTGWPLLKQLSVLGAKITLSANDPYPTFAAMYENHLWLFNQNGGRVSTMLGDVLAYSFNDVIDIREILHDLEWKEGWQ